MMSVIRNAMILMTVTIFNGCASAAPVQANLEPMAIQAQPSILTQNHFKSDKSGNLTEAQLREILESRVFLEEETRLGIVPVATAYEASGELPLTTVPANLSAALEKTGHFEVTTEVSTDWPATGSIAGLRELAARYRAKYLLLYRHRFEDRSRANAWGWTWPTVVGLFAAPVTTYEVAGVMEATLFDPRTGMILFTAYERVGAKDQHNIWNTEHKHRELKRQLLEEGTERLAATVVSKVGRLVASRPSAPNRSQAQLRQ